MSSLPKRILVADPDAIVVALISHILHRQGYTVDVALSIDDATARLRNSAYDAIVIETKLWPALDAFPDRISRTILLGKPKVDPPVFAVVSKPVEFSSLVETVAACVK